MGHQHGHIHEHHVIGCLEMFTSCSGAEPLGPYMVSRDAGQAYRYELHSWGYPKTDVNIVFADTWYSLALFDLSPRRKVQEILHALVMIVVPSIVQTSSWSGKIYFLHEVIWYA
jgi:hypothetical protein